MNSLQEDLDKARSAERRQTELHARYRRGQWVLPLLFCLPVVLVIAPWWAGLGLGLAVGYLSATTGDVYKGESGEYYSREW